MLEEEVNANTPTAAGVCLQCTPGLYAAGTAGCTSNAVHLVASLVMACALLVLAFF